MWRVYRRQGGSWRVALPIFLLIAGLAEGVGLTMLLPLFIALNESAADRSAASRAMLEAMTALGLPVTIGSLLALLVAVIALKAGLLLLVMRHVAAVVVRIAHQFRLSLIDALISARWSYFVEQPAGRLVQLLDQRVTVVGPPTPEPSAVVPAPPAPEPVEEPAAPAEPSANSGFLTFGAPAPSGRPGLKSHEEFMAEVFGGSR